MLNEHTRTAKVRVNVPNPQGKLKPEMFVRGRVRVQVAGVGRVLAPDLAGKWISPRHPQIVVDEPGTCPICSIELVPASEYGYAPEPVERAPVLTVPRSAVLMAGRHSVLYVGSPPGSGRAGARSWSGSRARAPGARSACASAT